SILQNSANEISWGRVLGQIPRVGAKSIKRIMDVFITKQSPLLSFINLNFNTMLQGKRVQKEGIKHLKKFQSFFKDLIFDEASGTILTENNLPPPTELLKKIIVFFKQYLELKYDNWNDRYNDLLELLNIAGKYTTLTDLVSELMISEAIFSAVASEDREYDEEKPLVLSTIHQAKGLEWKNVYIINCADGLFPHARCMNDDEEYEEERRLFYVACTRAKNRLVLTYPIIKMTYQGPAIFKRSTFIEEIADRGVFQEVELLDETGY
ncbi:MAG: 3'-5' exonuclease, partial [Promethearchaeota archaeon]